MNIKLDENLPTSLRWILAELGHDVDTALDEGLQGRPDAMVRAAAARDDRFLITQDLDFSDVRDFSAEQSPGIMILRLDQPDGQGLAHRVREVFAAHDVEQWRGCLVIVTDTKIRVKPR